jgi:hypothetical protein
MPQTRRCLPLFVEHQIHLQHIQTKSIAAIRL